MPCNVITCVIVLQFMEDECVEGTLAPGSALESCGEIEADKSSSNTSDSLEDERIFRLPKGLTLRELVQNTPEEIAKLRGFWKSTFAERNIKKVVAPMVDQSELAFRMMMRSHGADLTVTPMIHAHLFVNDTTYRRNSLAFCKKDRPLIVQFCANKPETFLSACRLVEGYCDGVDLNLGCPQMVAKRGRYGSYLQDEVDLICEMISAVRDYCKLPISCKIRIRDCQEQTRIYAKRLVEAGATMLTVHGRTREMKGPATGIADWSRIKEIVECVDVPVIANGNIQMPGDVERCLESTGAVAVMSAEGILYNPLLFANEHRETWSVAKEYLDYAKRFQAGISAVRAHLFRIMHHSLLKYDDLRAKVSSFNKIADFETVVDELKIRQESILNTEEGRHELEKARELFKSIHSGDRPTSPTSLAQCTHILSRPYFRISEPLKTVDGERTYKEKRKEELKELSEKLGLSIKQVKKREKRKILVEKAIASKKAKFPPCYRCSQPAGQGCKRQMCKKCCKYTCKKERADCPAHKSLFSHLEGEPTEATSICEGVKA